MTFYPSRPAGTVAAPSSKSWLIRAMILAAFASSETSLVCGTVCEDVRECTDALVSLGAGVFAENGIMRIRPCVTVPEKASLRFSECAAAARFLKGVTDALGIEASFYYGDRLKERLENDPRPVIRNGTTVIDGSSSSQIASGLLLGAAVAGKGMTLTVRDAVSEPYLAMTRDILEVFGVRCEKDNCTYIIKAEQKPVSPKTLSDVGDWSSAAVWLCAGALSKEGVTVTGLDGTSPQADRFITEALARFGAEPVSGDGKVTVRSAPLNGTVFSVKDDPDLFCVLAALASSAAGETTFTDIARLRMKESDRVAGMAEMLSSVGIDVRVTETALTVTGGRVRGGRVETRGDHRLVMAAALLSFCAENAIECGDVSCVAKSYPAFFEDFEAIGGKTVCHPCSVKK